MSTTIATKAPKRSFFDSLASGLNSLVNDLEKGFVKTSEEMSGAWAKVTDQVYSHNAHKPVLMHTQRFRRTFKFPPEERLIGEFWGQCISGGRAISCTCYVSSNHFSFVVDIPAGKATVGFMVCGLCLIIVKVIIPLKDIVSVQPAVSLRGLGAPVLQSIPNQGTRADAIQVFTTDMKVIRVIEGKIF